MSWVWVQRWLSWVQVSTMHWTQLMTTSVVLIKLKLNFSFLFLLRTSRQKLCTRHTSVRQMMLWSCQHVKCPHGRRRNRQEEVGCFVVQVLLNPKWLSLVSFMQSTMRFGGGQVFQQANGNALSRMVHWTSLRWCDSYVSCSPCFFLFSSRLCLTCQCGASVLTDRTTFRSNLDPDALTWYP